MAPEAADADYNLVTPFLQKEEIDAALTHYQKRCRLLEGSRISQSRQCSLAKRKSEDGKSIITGKHSNYVLTLRSDYNLSSPLQKANRRCNHAWSVADDTA